MQNFDQALYWFSKALEVCETNDINLKLTKSINKIILNTEEVEDAMIDLLENNSYSEHKEYQKIILNSLIEYYANTKKDLEKANKYLLYGWNTLNQ